MDAFLYNWLFSLGLCVLAYIGIYIALYINRDKNDYYEIVQKRNWVKWVKEVFVLLILSIVMAVIFWAIDKIGIIGMIILIGLPGALISMLGKK